MKNRYRERGAAAVEMAFVTILLVLLATGVADLGRVIYANIGVHDAAQEGVRFAAFNPPDNTPSTQNPIKQRASEATNFPAIDLADVTVDCPGPRTVSVEVSSTVDFITPMIGNLLGGSIELSQFYVSDVLVENDASC